ncbi:transporter substrate-binding domain-containing protein [Roseateles sp. DAIF2]|uniref:substrate-binding periplasmic protein n=1 Tax=Roseateles sp. DAIF2 TaxID=2714952 RepID=UPI0018A25653|nr:transporter substrate-binding domain-containing protein [Roseateles sp. DAIF2]QPF71587.1 transporter substrate-binding domain-containing protein [Roseateles sp. DAIF2]
MPSRISRRHLLRLLLLLAPALPAAATPPLAGLRVVSGDLPPFAIEGQPQRPGVLVEVVEELLRRAGPSPQRVEIYPWARAMQMAANNPRVAILPLTRTPEREPRYQWLLKLYVQHFVFINRGGQPPVSTLEQARGLRLTVLRASPNLAQLQRHGFDARQVVLANSVEDMLRLLERGHVDALYGGDVVNMDKVRSSGRDPAQFQVGLELEAGEVWLATSSGVEDTERARLQELYQAMLRDGSVERLFRAYGIRPREQDLR